MGLDKQPTPLPKRVREDAGGDSNISLKAPPKAQRAVNREDNLLQETSQPEGGETPVQEERVGVRAKTREGERRTQQLHNCREMPQRSDSASLPPQAMRKTLKQMMKAL